MDDQLLLDLCWPRQNIINESDSDLSFPHYKTIRKFLSAMTSLLRPRQRVNKRNYGSNGRSMRITDPNFLWIIAHHINQICKTAKFRSRKTLGRRLCWQTISYTVLPDVPKEICRPVEGLPSVLGTGGMERSTDDYMRRHSGRCMGCSC